MLADCCVPQCREWGTVAAVGRQRPPWSGCVFLPSFHLGTSRVTPKTTPKPTQNQPLSHLISPSIMGGWGRFKRQSSSKTCWQAPATRCRVNSLSCCGEIRWVTQEVRLFWWRCVTHHGKYGAHSQWCASFQPGVSYIKLTRSTWSKWLCTLLGRSSVALTI